MSLKKSVRDDARERANRRCEYCGKPEGISHFPRTVDPIIPSMHEGSNEVDNLAWACFECNVKKGTNIASYETRVLIPLFNPRTQKWADHFEIQNAVISGKTSEGRVTVRILDMNAVEKVEMRSRIIRAGRW